MSATRAVISGFLRGFIKNYMAGFDGMEITDRTPLICMGLEPLDYQFMAAAMDMEYGTSLSDEIMWKTFGDALDYAEAALRRRANI
jgi:hypothetical protein